MRCQLLAGSRYNPFDPIQDTESVLDALKRDLIAVLQPIRSDTGY